MLILNVTGKGVSGVDRRSTKQSRNDLNKEIMDYNTLSSSLQVYKYT